MKQAYKLSNPDHTLSPLTGMSRQHYIDCARYVLERAFKHVPSFETPIIFPTLPGSKSYPQPNDPPWRTRSHEFEALERTFNLAAPLIHLDPKASIHGINLRDFYLHHFYNALTPDHPNSLPMPDELPDATYQFTCEFGGWTKTMLLMPEVLWPHWTKKQQDQVAAAISKWAHHRTTQNNWRLFNICALSWLKLKGYAIDDELLKSHLLWIGSYHAGNGWYLEQSYNYYTISLFVVYGTIWVRTFGDKYYPEIASGLEKSFDELFKTYPNFFGRNGYINMWARSICYRLWISGGFPVSFLLKSQPLDPGWARRLCSGSLLQFTTREDFFVNDIPALGFYGHREFAIQNYSCPASPFIMFLPFIALALPEDSPFWTAKENDGMWTGLGRQSQRTVLAKPGLTLVNHGSSGTSEIISGKVYDDDHNYSKLVFNTHFPWEDHNPQGGTSQEYAFRSLDPRDRSGLDINFYLTGRAVDNAASKNAGYSTAQSILFNGVRDGVLYRQLLMRKPPANGVGYIIDLAEITIPGGVIRVDRCRLAFEHELTLGHFGLPHYADRPAALQRLEDGTRRVLTASIPGRQVALIACHGWDSVNAQVHRGFSAEAAESTVLGAYRKRTAKNPAMELMICVMLHKTDDSAWSVEELSPLREIKLMDITPSGSVIGAELTLASGTKHIVDFKDIDGFKSC
ncbi:MAG TPA: DUF2264 domain-containing protein [Verrucomicrobiae bacterium]|nr:DUF2264 domain-containing protein [Verrucomicrobiae bacterium]